MQNNDPKIEKLNTESTEAKDALSNAGAKSSSPWNIKAKIQKFYNSKAGRIISCVVLAALIVCIGLIAGKRFYQETPVIEPDSTSEPAAAVPTKIPSPTDAPLTEPTPDDEFIALLEQDVLELIAASSDPREAAELLTESQLEQLLEFADAEFSDDTTATLYSEYTAALELELSSFESTYNEADLLWYEGYCRQMQVFEKLKRSYSFLSDNTAFINGYIEPLSETAQFFNKWKIINSDLQKQINAVTYLDYVNDYRYSVTLKNSTNYTYDAVFYFSNYRGSGEDKELLCEAEDTLSGINPLKKFVVTNRVPSGVRRVSSFECHWAINKIS